MSVIVPPPLTHVDVNDSDWIDSVIRASRRRLIAGMSPDETIADLIISGIPAHAARNATNAAKILCDDEARGR